jgi:hypothetical protein
MNPSYFSSPYNDPGFVAALVIALMIVLIIYLAIYIPFLINLSGALKQVAPHLRKMPPGQVWLMLIPVFGNIWVLFVVPRIADSLVGEYKRRGMTNYEEERPGYRTGMSWGVLGLVTYLRTIADLTGIPVIGSFGTLASFAGLVFFIIYWVKIAKYKNQLRNSGTWEQYMFAETGNYGQQNGNQQNPNLWQNPQQQQNWNQPPATPPQQNWAPPANPQNTPPPPPPGGNTGGIDLNKRD